MLRPIYTCGLRPNEGGELKHKNVHLDTGEILIADTKNSKERMIVMSYDMQALCKLYDMRRLIFAPESECFLPSPNGDAYPNTWHAKEFKRRWLNANKRNPPIHYHLYVYMICVTVLHLLF